MRQFGRLLVLVVLAATAACAGGDERAAAPASPRATQDQANGAGSRGNGDLEAAKDFTLRTLDGDTFTLSDHFGELPVVLNFWAPW